MIKNHFLLIIAAITAFIILVSYDINTSFLNKKNLTNIESIYFPALEALDATTVKIDKIENLLLQSVTTGDETLIDDIRLLKKQSDLSLLGIKKINLSYQNQTNEIINEFDQYINLGIIASSLLYKHQFLSQSDVNLNNINQQIFAMNQRLASLRSKINSFRNEIYNSFTNTLHTANSRANIDINIEIISACIALIIISVLTYFVHQYFTTLNPIKNA